MYSRIIGRQYVETDFVDRNRFDAGRRTEEFFRYLEGYIKQSKRWERILKPVLAHTHITSITEICPGWAPKIELALGRLAYTGSITLFDENLTSMKKLEDFAHFFYPELQIHTKTGNVFSKTKKPQSDLTVCNHIIDDLVLSLYTTNTRMQLYDLYESENIFIQATQNISKNHQLITQAAETITASLLRFIKKDSLLIIAQYPGLTETSLHLTSWIQCIHTVATNVYILLTQKGINAQILR